MENHNSKNSKLNENNKKDNNQQIISNKFQNKKDENNEIIIELEINNDENEKEINILCDKNKIIEDIEENTDYYEENNINPPKEFNYFNKKNTQLFLMIKK